MAQEAEIKTQDVATILKTARKKKKLTIKAVSKETCVRSCYLEAFESGKFNELPALAFALGFVKAYAKALDLDPSMIGQQFKAEFITAQEDSSSDKTVATDAKKTSQAHVVPAYQMADKPKKRWPAWISPIVGLAGAGLSWMWLGAGSVSVATVASVDPATDARVLAALGETSAVVEPAVQQTSTPAQGQVVPSSTSFLPAAHANDAVVLGPTNNNIVIEASEDSWLQLSYSDGTELWSGVLRAGQSYRPELIGDVFLTTSNAGGISLKHEESTLGPLGGRGELIDALELTQDDFLEVHGKQQSAVVAGTTGE